MTFKELQNVSHKIRAAATLELFAPRHLRKLLKEILVLTAPIVIIISMFFADEAHLTLTRLYGILFALLFLWLILFMLDSFFYSMYFRGIHTTMHEQGFSDKVSYVPFEVLYLVFSTNPDDVTAGFINSPAGQTILSRLDIDKTAGENFLASRKSRIKGSQLNFQGEPTLASYFGVIYDSDQEFAKFLATFGFKRGDVIGASDWVARIYEAEKIRLRWWGRDSLGRVRGVGKEWAHGETHHLEKYGKYLTGGGFALGEETYSKEVSALERVLLRTEGAGALVVGENNDDALEVVRGLAEQITSGTVLPNLEHKRIFYLDSAAFVSVTGSKTDFEKEFVNILEEALRAEHVIFVIPNFASFLSDAKSFEVDVIEILGPYLRSSGLQIIALSDKDAFIDQLQKNVELMSKFEKILVTGHEREAILHALEEKVSKVERETKLFFTYPALVHMAAGAERYFSDSSVTDKTADLLAELVSKTTHGQRKTIKASDVTNLIKEKTNIPLGEVGPEEKSKLINLENVLHERIVGQDAAVKAISNALRRARSGINNENRPMGSFLFLGPTGVGKTETTKALAETFFGSKAEILRLDMSEYNSPDSLARLIGSFESGKAGTLSTLLRDHPYGVLLLDEFEKSDKKVLDLFLQILDEGFFSDMRGRKVNARNLIIIATSNAAGDMIWNLSKEGKDVNTSRDEIIETIINRGIYKPELLNRFDGVIFFHPLTTNHLKQVAKLLLIRLQERLKEKGIDLVINDDLINFLIKQGTDQKFGARPINRAIQENIEELIAEKIINGEVKAGSRVELRESDLIGKVSA